MCNGPRTICNAAYSLPIHCLCTAHFLPIHAHPLTGTEPWNNSALWRVMGRVLTASAGPLVVLYSSSIPLFILYSSSILLYSPLFILYSSSIEPRLSLDWASLSLSLCSSSINLWLPCYFIHPPFHYALSSCTPAPLCSSLFILYPSFSHPRSYSSCFSVDPSLLYSPSILYSFWTSIPIYSSSVDIWTDCDVIDCDNRSE
jgi:hypothetical protein